jgi:prepilin-type N-terminal cleavage/methylation domain-containing protein
MECWSNGIYEMSFNVKRRIETCNGFTLVEALFSVVLLGIMATAIAVPYISGFQSLDVQADRMLLDCRLRSRMEMLVGTNFGSLGNGSEVVAINGKNYTISWTAVNLDLDGDLNPEPNAKQVTVTIPELSNRSLTTILVDNENTVGKIP